MMPETEAAAADRGPPVKPGKRAGRRAAREGGAEPPVARVLQLVAALKAEQEAPPPAPPPANDAGERIHVMEQLKQILAAREDERGAWEARGSELEAQLKAAERDAGERARMMEQLKQTLAAREDERSVWAARVSELEAQLKATESIAVSARLAVEEAAVQHERLMSDLKLMHEHQRSIWYLERRQLEIALGALQKAQQRRLLPRLARPAMVAAILLVFAAAVALSSDSNAHASSASVYFDDVVHTVMNLSHGS